MTMIFNGIEWTEIAYAEITKGMRILVVSESAGVTFTREGVADERTEDTEGDWDAWWCKDEFLVRSDLNVTIYAAADGADAARRPIAPDELLANIGAIIERTETFEIIEDNTTPTGWSYRAVPGAKTRRVVIKDADPDASVLATIRKSLDLADPAEADEKARQILAGLRTAGLVS